MYSQVFCYYLLRKSRKRLSPLFLSVLACDHWPQRSRAELVGSTDESSNRLQWSHPGVAPQFSWEGNKDRCGTTELCALERRGILWVFCCCCFYNICYCCCFFFLFTSSSDQSYQQEARFTHAVFGARSGSKNNDKYKSFLYILPLIIHYCLWLKTTAPKMQV